jgi:hypothetical protein
MQGLLKYLTLTPVVATLLLVFVSTVLILLNYWFPGLQYGTYFKPLP